MPRTNTSSIASTGTCITARDNASTRADVGISSIGTAAGTVPISILDTSIGIGLSTNIDSRTGAITSTSISIS